MDSKIDIPRRKKRIVYIPANDASLPAVYDIYLPANGTVLEVKRSLADAAGIGPEDDVDIEEKTLMFSVYNHCIHRVFQNESKTNVLEDVEGLLYLCEVKSSKSYVDIELTNRLPSGLTPFGHPTVIPIPRPQLSSISLKDLRVIVRSGITPFLKDGWQPGEKDSDLYSIVIMDEAASSIRHEIQYDIQTVNLKQFVGKRGGFSVSLLWKKAARHRYIDRFFTFLAHPKSILVPNAGVKPDGGYPDTIFCNPDTVRDFICPICMDVVRDPMETECGHLFCMQCVDRLLDGINKEKLCPMKCGMISKASVHPLGNFTKRKVMAFAVQCISAPDCE